MRLVAVLGVLAFQLPCIHLSIHPFIQSSDVYICDLDMCNLNIDTCNSNLVVETSLPCCVHR